MLEPLRQEMDAGFPSLAGARLTGSLPLSESLVNGWLRRIPNAPNGLALDIHPANRIVARYGMVTATAVLDEHVQVGHGPPRIGLELASSVLAWALRQTVRVPGLSITGRRVTVDLGALPALRGHGRHWSHLRAVRLRTSPGKVQVDFEVAVT